MDQVGQVLEEEQAPGVRVTGKPFAEPEVTTFTALVLTVDSVFEKR